MFQTKGKKQYESPFAQSNNKPPIHMAENSEKLIRKKVSVGTLRCKMKRMDFKTYVICKVMDITANNQAQSLAFAREHINK